VLPTDHSYSGAKGESMDKSLPACNQIGKLVKQLNVKAKEAHVKIQYVQNVCFRDYNSLEAENTIADWKCRFNKICGLFFNLCECPGDDENYRKENLKRLLTEFTNLCREIDLCKKQLYKPY